MARNAGNSCLLCLQSLAVFGLILVSFGLIGIGVWLIVQTQNASIFEIGFIVLGALEFFLCILAYSSQNSKSRMECVLYILGSLILVQAITAGIAYAEKDQIINWAAENHPNDYNQFKNLIEDNVNIALIIGLAATGTQILCFLFTWFYICSMKRVTGAHSIGLMSDTSSGGDRISLINHHQNEEKERIREKYDEKRKRLKEKVAGSQIPDDEQQPVLTFSHAIDNNNNNADDDNDLERPSTQQENFIVFF